MDRQQKNEIEIGNYGRGDNKRRKEEYYWDQDDTERLCKLLLEHGKSGILNKITNAATNEKKKQQWEIVARDFNASLQVFSVCLFWV